MARWHSLWMTPALPADLEREINVERMVMIARYQPLSAGAHSLVSLLLAVTYFRLEPTAITIYAGAIQVLAALQFSVWYRHRGKSRPRGVSDKTINRIFAW